MASRKRVHALLRAPDGSGFLKCGRCGASVPFAIFDMHQCGGKRGWWGATRQRFDLGPEDAWGGSVEILDGLVGGGDKKRGGGERLGLADEGTRGGSADVMDGIRWGDKGGGEERLLGFCNCANAEAKAGGSSGLELGGGSRSVSDGGEGEELGGSDGCGVGVDVAHLPKSAFRYFMDNFKESCESEGSVEIDRRGFQKWKDMPQEERRPFFDQSDKVYYAYEELLQEEVNEYSAESEEVTSKLVKAPRKPRRRQVLPKPVQQNKLKW